MQYSPPADFIQLDSVSSTNTWGKEHASTLNASHITCITAREQTSGRGRQNKTWLSPKDANLYLTLCFIIPSPAPYLANLGQIMALSAAQLLMGMGIQPELKWPNDLLVSKKKIGGVLTETIPLHASTQVIIGLGLNVNMPEELLKTLDQPATSLHLLLHEKTSPQSLVQPLLIFFVRNLLKLQSEGFAPFQPLFQKLLAYKGAFITVQLPQKRVQGTCDSITQEGCLKLRLPSGEYLMLSSGEVY